MEVSSAEETEEREGRQPAAAAVSFLAATLPRSVSVFVGFVVPEPHPVAPFRLQAMSTMYIENADLNTLATRLRYSSQYRNVPVCSNLCRGVVVHRQMLCRYCKSFSLATTLRDEFRISLRVLVKISVRYEAT